MSSFQSSSVDLRVTAANAGIIESAIGRHPIHHLSGGDFGHADVAAAVASFRNAWMGEFSLRQRTARGSAQFLTTAAADTERVDRLLAEAAAKLGGCSW